MNNFRGEIQWNVVPSKIDLTDRKIVFLLCQNARISNTAIGKHLKLKREVVSYRIKKMMDGGFINGFVARLNARRLGFCSYFVYFKLKNLPLEKEMINYLLQNPEITNVKNTGGRFDILTEFTCKNIEEFSSIFQNIINTFRNSIRDYSINQIITEHILGTNLLLEDNRKELERLKHIRENKGSSFHKEFASAGKKTETVILSEVDKQILNLIKQNARKNLNEIALETNTNYLSVQKRIGRMIRSGIITQFQAFVSIAHLGYQMYPVLMNIYNVDEHKLLTYLKIHPNICWAYKLVGNWNYQINIFAKNNAHFQNIVNDFKEHFSENSVAFDPIMVFNSYKVEQRVE